MKDIHQIEDYDDVKDCIKSPQQAAVVIVKLLLQIYDLLVLIEERIKPQDKNNL